VAVQTNLENSIERDEQRFWQLRRAIDALNWRCGRVQAAGFTPKSTTTSVRT
jgi:hypothetical protein